MSDIQKINGICIGVGVRGKSWCQWAQDAGMNVVGVVDINETLLNEVCDELEVPEAMRFTSIADGIACGITELDTAIGFLRTNRLHGQNVLYLHSLVHA